MKLKLKLAIGVLLTAVALVGGGTVIRGNSWVTGVWDASRAVSTKPFRLVDVLPAACTLGETAFLTTAAAGSNLHLCTGPNAWTQVSSGAASFTQSFTNASTVTLNHNLNRPDAVVQCRTTDTEDTTISKSTIAWIDNNTARVDFDADGRTGVCVVR